MPAQAEVEFMRRVHGRLPLLTMVRGRMDFIVARCAGKQVLHLGCVDAGLHRGRLRSGEHLHARLASGAASLWGVDIDKTGVREMEAVGFRNLLIADVCAPTALDPMRGLLFDVVVASEVLEHVTNPGLFLENVLAVMHPERTELVVTVPNAFAINTLLGLLENVERVHPDHNYWFSYRTACTLLSKCGLSVVESYAYTFEPYASPAIARRQDGLQGRSLVARARARVRGLVRRALAGVLFRRSSSWSDGLILICRAGQARSADAGG